MSHQPQPPPDRTPAPVEVVPGIGTSPTPSDASPRTPPPTRSGPSTPERPSAGRKTPAPVSGTFGALDNDFFEHGGALEAGLAPPPEESTWMVKGAQKIARQARRSLPLLIAGGCGLVLFVALILIRALAN
jgi:hypothetical protein